MSFKKKKSKTVEESQPVSETSAVLVSVEDLINLAMGPADGNTVNYKMLQTVLHLLARQMRMLETKCDIKTTDVTYLSGPKKEATEDIQEELEKKVKAKEKSPKNKRKKGETAVEDIDQKETEAKDTIEQKLLHKLPPNEKDLFLIQKKIEVKIMQEMTTLQKEQYFKQKENEIQELLEMKPKEREKYFIEKEKELEALYNMTPQERDPYLKEKEKEKEALEKMTPKERKKYLKEKILIASSSGSSIVVTEAERQNEKVLVVEKGPATRGPSKSRTSIEVVTLSQFELLQAQVKDVRKNAGPVPLPSMPDDEQLKAQLLEGTASLTDIMQAMQLSARVQAAEAGLERMASLLTQLAASGHLPENLVQQVEEARAEMERLRGDFNTEVSEGKVEARMGPRKSVGIAVEFKDKEDYRSITGSRPASSSPSTARRSSVAAGSISMATSRQSSYTSSVQDKKIAVNRNEMDDAIQLLRDDLMKNVHQLTNRAGSTADTAACTAKSISDKMDIAIGLNNRISDLYALTTDYADQLTGFDAGLATQMQSFQEQISQMRSDLKTGLTTLESANNNAETAAVQELTDRYLGLDNEMESSSIEHQRLLSYQTQLSEELQGLVEAVETLREQKADRDEVWDGIRDKANVSKLAGLLTEEEFERERAELDSRLELCYDKFNKQDNVWMNVMKDMTDIADQKAKIMQLMSVKDNAQKQLNDVLDKLKILEIQLGEPKAAMLTRTISKDGKCGACKMPALIEAKEPSADRPAPLPALHPPLDAPCTPALQPCVFEDENIKLHMCNRWVGGSHTLVPRSVPREEATAPPVVQPPARRYAGYGVDGKMYRMAEELEPCLECNTISTEEVKGGGDADMGPCPCWAGVPDPGLKKPKPELNVDKYCTCD